MRIRVVVLGAACLCAVALTHCKPSRPPLQLTFEPGQKAALHIVSASNISISGAMAISVAQTLDSVLNLDVTQVFATGMADIQTQIEHMNLEGSISVGGLAIPLASSDANNPFAAVMEQLKGKTFTTRVRTDGEIDQIVGTSIIADEVMERTKLSGTERLMMREVVKDMLDPENLEGFFKGTVFHALPGTVVKPATTWTHVYQMRGSLPFLLEATYTVTGINDGKVYADVVYKMLKNPENVAAEFGDFAGSIDITGEGKGSVVLIETSGWVISSEMSLRFQGTVSASGAQGGKIEGTIREEVQRADT